MFFHAVLKSLEAHEVRDHPADPFNRAIEFFQTYRICELQTIDNVTVAPWARLGFSMRGGPRSGVKLRKGDALQVMDPQITHGLPTDAMDEDVRYQWRFDFHNWESDSARATERVRAAFTDTTLQYLLDIWRRNVEDEDAARAALRDWLRGRMDSLIDIIAASGGPVSKGVATHLNLLPLLDAIAEYVKSNAAEHFDMHRFVLQTKGTGGNFLWRVIAAGADGEPEWNEGPGKQRVNLTSFDASRRNWLQLTYRFRMID